MSPLTVAVIAFIALVVIFTAVWAWQVKSKNAGMIDPIWAMSLGVVAVLYRGAWTRRSAYADHCGNRRPRLGHAARVCICGSATPDTPKMRDIASSASNGAPTPTRKCSGSSSCKS